MSETPIVKKKIPIKKILLLTLNFIVIIALGAGTIFFYLRYQAAQNNNLTDDQLIAKYQKEISKTFTLPNNEKPALGKVNDAESIKKANPDFFKNLTNQDILLIYNNAPLVVIYRPTTKKIIGSGQLKFTNKVLVSVIGTKADRSAAIGIIKQAFDNDVTVTTEIDAKTPITTGTIVVDTTGKNTELATKLATELKGKVGNAPEGQDKPLGTTGIAIYLSPAATTPTVPTSTPKISQ